MDTSKNLFPHDHYVNADRRKELINQKPLLIWLSDCQAQENLP